MRTLLLLLFSCLPCLAQFGVEQPMFWRTTPAASCDSPCDFPVDSFVCYSNAPVSLDGADEGCGGWTGAYVAHVYYNLPEIAHQDTMEAYSAAAELAGLTGGINWFAVYVVHTYQNMPMVRYLDAFDEYAADDSMILDTLGGGTNYFAGFVTNAISTQGWTNGAYVGKGY